MATLTGTALITGGGSGIGQATAFAFAKSGLSNLVLTDISEKNLADTVQHIQGLGTKVQIETIIMDVADEEQVNAAIQKTVEKFGSLDYAVNNAGIGGPREETADMDVKGWQRCFDVNATGVFMCQKAELKQMLKQEAKNPRGNKGVIVNVASMLGTTALPWTLTNTAYVASKHAVVGLTKTDGVYYATKGVRINAVCPGYVATPLLQATIDDGLMKEEFGRVPAGRLASMEEIADSILFLASPQSSYMYAHSLVVDGGYCAY